MSTKNKLIIESKLYETTDNIHSIKLKWIKY